MQTPIKDGPGALDPDDIELDDELLAAIASAEAAVGAMADDYPAMLVQDVELLDAALTQLTDHAPGTDAHTAACVDTFGVLHDIKGQAASFGYAAATDLCDPLCECVRGKASVSDEMVALLKQASALLSAMAEEGVTDAHAQAVAALLQRVPASG